MKVLKKAGKVLLILLPVGIIYTIYRKVFRKTQDDVVAWHILQILRDGEERTAYNITRILEREYSDRVSGSQMDYILQDLENRMFVTSRKVHDVHHDRIVTKYKATGRMLPEPETEKKWFLQRLRHGHNPTPLPA